MSVPTKEHCKTEASKQAKAHPLLVFRRERSNGKFVHVTEFALGPSLGRWLFFSLLVIANAVDLETVLSLLRTIPIW